MWSVIELIIFCCGFYYTFVPKVKYIFLLSFMFSFQFDLFNLLNLISCSVLVRSNWSFRQIFVSKVLILTNCLLGNHSSNVTWYFL